MQIDEEIDLIEIHKKIVRIEEKDPNFTKNEKWKNLRDLQMKGYIILAKNELSTLNLIKNNDFKKQKKEKLERFLKKYDKQK